MSLSPAELSATEVEKLVLRAMCQPSLGEGKWLSVAEPLKTYRWREPVHEALFRALGDLRARKPALLRELLPAALTRRGFPDIDWQEFLEPVNLTDEDVRSLVARLISGSRA